MQIAALAAMILISQGALRAELNLTVQWLVSTACSPAREQVSTSAEEYLHSRGFEIVDVAGIHPSGWPYRIRSSTDDSIMALVPGGRISLGLGPEKITALARIEVVLSFKKDTTSPEERVDALKRFLFNDLLINGELTEDELKAYEVDQLFALRVLFALRNEGDPVPEHTVAAWKESGMSVEVFLSTPEICERLPADYVQVFESIGQMKRDLHDKEKEDPVATTALEIADDVRHQEEYVFPSFYMDIFEVTNKQYKQFMQAVQHDKHLPQIIQGVAPGERHPGRVVYDLWSDRKRNLDFQPVTCVSGEDAAAYAAWAGKSLPTRLQWEYAASGGKHIFPWGDDFKSSYCCSKVYDFSRGVLGLPVYLSSAVPSTVGAFNHDRSMFGCFDLAGNASEWVLSESGCYKLVGGNAGSFQVLELVPSKTDFFVETPTLYGFRTVLNLPTGEPSEDPPQHPGPK
jgi:hypothetical protein